MRASGEVDAHGGAASGPGAGIQLVEHHSKLAEFFKVRCRQTDDERVALRSELHADDARVVWIGDAPDEPGRLGAVYQLDSTVMTQQEVTGQIADGRRSARRVALDRHEQLMLNMGEARLLSLRLAPVLELAEADAEREQSAEVLSRGLAQFHSLVTNSTLGGATRRPPA